MIEGRGRGGQEDEPRHKSTPELASNHPPCQPVQISLSDGHLLDVKIRTIDLILVPAAKHVGEVIVTICIFIC